MCGESSAALGKKKRAHAPLKGTSVSGSVPKAHRRPAHHLHQMPIVTTYHLQISVLSSSLDVCSPCLHLAIRASMSELTQVALFCWSAWSRSARFPDAKRPP